MFPPGLGTYPVRQLENAEDLRFDPAPSGFASVKAISEVLERLYAEGFSPAIRSLVNPEIARALRSMHPMRTSRMAWSERITPGLSWAPCVATWFRPFKASEESRRDKPWYQLERATADFWGHMWTTGRVFRDQYAEVVFGQMYANWPFKPATGRKEGHHHEHACQVQGDECVQECD